MLRIILIGFSFLILFSSEAAGRQRRDIKSGSRVRVTYLEETSPSPSEIKVIGTLVGLDEDFILVEPSSSDNLLTIPRKSMLVLEKSLAKSRKGRGTLIGLGVGAGVGALIGLAVGGEDEGLVQATSGEMAAVGAILFAPIGALVGLVTSPGEQWQSYSVTKVRLVFRSERRSNNGIFVSLNF